MIHKEDCGRLELITDYGTGEVNCKNCGSVINEKPMEVISSFKTNDDGVEINQTGPPTSIKFADMGLSTLIGSVNKDSTGKFLNGENKRIFHRLRIWDKRSVSKSHNASYSKAFTLLDSLKTKLSLPESVVQKSALMYRKSVTKKILVGRSTAEILCSLVYLACRLSNTPRSIQDISEAANIKKKSLQRIYRMLLRELDIKPETFSPTDFVNKISYQVNASEQSRRLAIDILAESMKLGMCEGKNPVGLASASVYLATAKYAESVSQTDISNASGISAVTIRERAKLLKQVADKMEARN
ncbi:MAG: transcription factor TFIIB [Crenarchaeota archaeon]|nr:MAG: transcription factor TFIIB [Thermoproteota archaeon]RDJ33937.1 MAG: transcription factor TFIIB [Thermoproteota archaeon]RDJ36951.1 MAG: transcription factor TFIIB [Thermoproteota archaeon]RDJ37514.1 MAG: transcription factor TFIIB [Thermoproteota archaeon]